MKKFYKLTSVALIACSFAMASCDDDDETIVINPNPGNPGAVLPDGLPSAINGQAVSTNTSGQITQIGTGAEAVKFEYGAFTPAGTDQVYSVVMKEEDDNIYMQTNAQGFVSNAYQVYSDGSVDTWTFEYNSDGRLTRMYRSEGEEITSITYKDGDITNVRSSEVDGDYSEYTFIYTNSQYTTKVPNKGNVMMFDDFFHIDMDEMGVAYYAGLLGKPTANLPMGYSETWKEGGSTGTDTGAYNWTFNDDQLPTKFYEESDPWDAVTFTWN